MKKKNQQNTLKTKQDNSIRQRSPHNNQDSPRDETSEQFHSIIEEIQGSVINNLYLSIQQKRQFQFLIDTLYDIGNRAIRSQQQHNYGDQYMSLKNSFCQKFDDLRVELIQYSKLSPIDRIQTFFTYQISQLRIVVRSFDAPTKRTSFLKLISALESDVFSFKSTTTKTANIDSTIDKIHQDLEASFPQDSQILITAQNDLQLIQNSISDFIKKEPSLKQALSTVESKRVELYQFFDVPLQEIPKYAPTGLNKSHGEKKVKINNDDDKGKPQKPKESNEDQPKPNKIKRRQFSLADRSLEAVRRNRIASNEDAKSETAVKTRRKSNIDPKTKRKNSVGSEKIKSTKRTSSGPSTASKRQREKKVNNDNDVAKVIQFQEEESDRSTDNQAHDFNYNYSSNGSKGIEHSFHPSNDFNFNEQNQETKGSRIMSDDEYDNHKNFSDDQIKKLNQLIDDENKQLDQLHQLLHDEQPPKNANTKSGSDVVHLSSSSSDSAQKQDNDNTKKANINEAKSTNSLQTSKSTSKGSIKQANSTTKISNKKTTTTTTKKTVVHDYVSKGIAASMNPKTQKTSKKQQNKTKYTNDQLSHPKQTKISSQRANSVPNSPPSETKQQQNTKKVQPKSQHPTLKERQIQLTEKKSTENLSQSSRSKSIGSSTTLNRAIKQNKKVQNELEMMINENEKIRKELAQLDNEIDELDYEINNGQKSQIVELQQELENCKKELNERTEQASMMAATNISTETIRAYEEYISSLKQGNESRKLINNEMRQMIEDGSETHTVAFTNSQLSNEVKQLEKEVDKTMQQYEFLVQKRNGIVNSNQNSIDKMLCANSLLMLENAVMKEEIRLIETSITDEKMGINKASMSYTNNDKSNQKMEQNLSNEIILNKIEEIKEKTQQLDSEFLENDDNESFSDMESLPSEDFPPQYRINKKKKVSTKTQLIDRSTFDSNVKKYNIIREIQNRYHDNKVNKSIKDLNDLEVEYNRLADEINLNSTKERPNLHVYEELDKMSVDLNEMRQAFKVNIDNNREAQEAIIEPSSQLIDVEVELDILKSEMNQYHQKKQEDVADEEEKLNQLCAERTQIAAKLKVLDELLDEQFGDVFNGRKLSVVQKIEMLNDAQLSSQPKSDQKPFGEGQFEPENNKPPGVYKSPNQRVDDSYSDDSAKGPFQQQFDHEEINIIKNQQFNESFSDDSNGYQQQNESFKQSNKQQLNDSHSDDSTHVFNQQQQDLNRRSNQQVFNDLYSDDSGYQQQQSKSINKSKQQHESTQRSHQEFNDSIRRSNKQKQKDSFSDDSGYQQQHKSTEQHESTQRSHQEFNDSIRRSNKQKQKDSFSDDSNGYQQQNKSTEQHDSKKVSKLQLNDSYSDDSNQIFNQQNKSTKKSNKQQNGSFKQTKDINESFKKSNKLQLTDSYSDDSNQRTNKKHLKNSNRKSNKQILTESYSEDTKQQKHSIKVIHQFEYSDESNSPKNKDSNRQFNNLQNGENEAGHKPGQKTEFDLDDSVSIETEIVEEIQIISNKPSQKQKQVKNADYSSDMNSFHWSKENTKFKKDKKNQQRKVVAQHNSYSDDNNDIFKWQNRSENSSDQYDSLPSSKPKKNPVKFEEYEVDSEKILPPKHHNKEKQSVNKKKEFTFNSENSSDSEELPIQKGSAKRQNQLKPHLMPNNPIDPLKYRDIHNGTPIFDIEDGDLDD